MSDQNQFFLLEHQFNLMIITLTLGHANHHVQAHAMQHCCFLMVDEGISLVCFVLIQCYSGLMVWLPLGAPSTR